MPQQMGPKDWQQVKVILHEALKRAPGEMRDTYVAQTCAGDTTLRTEIQAFLGESSHGVEAFAENLRHTLFNRVWSNTIGQRLGAYRITREIGRGGMGAVYLAERADGQFDKEVAIKLLKRGTDTDEILHRFRAERQMLARLEHPYIARLLDAGTSEDGLPYFVMEYVDGIPVTDFVRERQLDVNARLELFLKICAAVESAHRRQIIHRDLKPTNILVNAEGEPKLLDFGIAKLLVADEATQRTALQEQRLTPNYASPEQARGELVTPASDIYALGALLCEMLTGRTPHHFSSTQPSLAELAQVLSNEEPSRPSRITEDPALQQQLRGDLDEIVAHAMEQDPVARYASVADLAEDIRRFLRRVPVQARNRTAGYLARFGIRNRPTRFRVAAATILLLSLTGLTIGLLTFSKPAGPRKETTASSSKSIAVLPFDSLGEHGAPDYFVDGVQDDVITDLASISNLKVIGRSSVAQYRGLTIDAKEIGRALGVGHVLEGSVQRGADRVRVNVRLIDTRTNVQVWAQSYERSVDDLFVLQSELAKTIVAQLEVSLSQSEKEKIESRPTQDIKAYDLYLQARQLIHQFGSNTQEEDWRAGSGILDTAIARDPNFALAYCLSSEVDSLLYRYYDHTPARLARAKQSAETAIRLAPRLGESHLAQAKYYYHALHDYVRAQNEIGQAAPTLSGTARFLAFEAITQRRLGHWTEALQDNERALALEPRGCLYASTLIESYLALRRLDDVDRLADKTIAQLPLASTGSIWRLKRDRAITAGTLDQARVATEKSPNENTFKAVDLALVAFYQRHYAEAARLLASAPAKAKMPDDMILEGKIQELLGNAESAAALFNQTKDVLEARLRQTPEDPGLLSSLAVAYTRLGRKDEGLQTAKRAVALFPIYSDAIDGPNCVVALAEIYAWTGDRNAALNQLATVAQLPGGANYGDLRYNPVWDAIREDSRFEEILRQAQAPPVIN